MLRIGGDVPADTIRQHIVDFAPSLEIPMASAAEQLIQQGREEGREEGRAATLRQTIERLLQLRFGPLDEPLRSRIASAPVEELERFIERVITATQLDDVFAG